MHRMHLRVLVVDDSAMFRRLLTNGLSRAVDIEIVGTAENAAQAREMIATCKPNVITLDLEMPQENGLSLLRSYIATNPIATVVISSTIERGVRRTIEALEAGADEVISKSTIMANDPTSWRSLHHILRRVVAAREARKQGRVSSVPVRETHPQITRSFPSDWVIGMASSTGGVQALGAVLPMMPKNAPPIVMVQHMPEGFTRAFADRLNEQCEIEVREANDNDVLRPGLALLAPGGVHHMIVSKQGGEYRVHLKEGAQVSYSRPSADVLFHSLARSSGNRTSAAVLTGMGRDGADGLAAIRQSGGRTFVQDEVSSAVYGMPKRAWDIGAAEARLPIIEVAPELLRSVGTKPARTAARDGLNKSPFDLKGTPR
jgi:two-component system chemotaxis response regulator CheB